MTDIFGAVATGFHLARKIGQYAKAVSEAREDLMMLEQEIDSSCRALQKIEKFVEKEGSNSKEFQEWLPALKESKRLHDEKLDEIQQKLDKIQKRNISPRLWWPMEQKSFKEKLADLRRIHEPFSQFLDIIQMENIQRLEAGFQNLNTGFEAEQREKRWREAITWLYPDSGMEVIERKIRSEESKARDSQPVWILGKKPYLEWISSASGASSHWIWGLGEAGSGKTCITSFLVRHLRGNIGLSDPPPYPGKLDSNITQSSVAIFYCDYKQKKEDQDTSTILKCLSRQLLSQLQTIDPERSEKRLGLVERLRDRETKGTTRASTQKSQYIDVKTLLEALVNDFPRTYLIVDALDENQAGYKEVLSQLEMLTTTSLRIFVTSRDGKDGNLRHHAETLGALQLQVRPEDKELRSYINARLDRIANRSTVESTQGSALVDAVTDPDKRIEIAEKVFEKAVGNFLCAELQITGLKDCTTVEELENSIENLPTTLEALFQRAIERVEGQESAEARDVGKRCLLWCIYARKSLSVAEVKHALAIYPIRKSRIGGLKADAGPSTREILESTRYFLSINDTSATIQIHKAVREYCDNPEIEQRYFSNAQYEITRICLQYLSITNFESGRCTSKSEWETRIKENKFLEYAAQNWGYHMSMIDDEEKLESVRKQVLKTFRDRNYLDVIGEAIQPAIQERIGHAEYCQFDIWGPFDSEVENIVPAIHLFVYFDLEDLADEWLESGYGDVEDLSPARYTALWLACRLGKSKMVRLLLRQNADPSRENGNKRFCLAVAAYMGHLDVVKQLLAYKSKEKPPLAEKLLGQGNWYGRLPLTDAANAGKTEVVNTILQYMKTMDKEKHIKLLLHQDKNGYTELHESVYADSAPVIEALVGFEGAEELLNAHTTVWKDTPLHTATVNAKPESIKTLLRVGADIHARQSQGKTPLHLSVQLPFPSHGKITEVLMNQGADPRIRDNDGKSVLHCASDHGRSGQVKLLLRYGIRDLLSWKDNYGHTPITAAAKGKNNDWIGVVSELCTLSTDTTTLTTTTTTTSTETPTHDCEPRFNCLRSVRSELLVFSKQDSLRNHIYLVSQTIPANIQVHRIAFTITSRDQGDSDHIKKFPWDKGSFHESGTWFDIGILRSGNLIHCTEITRNKHGWEELETYNMFWGIARAHFGAGSRSREPGSQKQIFEFLALLQAGDRVAVVPRVRTDRTGWFNIVSRVELTIFYPKAT